MNHFTDKKGFQGIRASSPWRFLAHQPPDPRHHPFGAYFTIWPPDTPHLACRLGIPKRKLEYVFQFVGRDDLVPLNNDRGKWIFYSPGDYHVIGERQSYHGKADES